MKKLVQTLKNIWTIEDLRKRIIFTLGILLIYRFGSHVVIPGIDASRISVADSGGIFGLIDMFSGGAFGRASIFALGIMPYISASIAMQLLGMAVPYFQKMQKEGESGRRKFNQITRYLTVVVTVFQAAAYLAFITTSSQGAIVIQNPTFFAIMAVIVLTAGTVFVMWLGEKITDRGIGNGISLLITIGIIAVLPGAIAAEIGARFGAGQGIALIIEFAVLFIIVIATIALVQGVRRIPVQFAKQVVGRGSKMMQTGGNRRYIPLKVNASGVMPIIFAQALMMIPSFFAPLMPDSGFLQSMTTGNYFTSFSYNAIFFIMIVLFTYLYTALIINPVNMANEMKQNGGFIPGVKPGRKTAEFIDSVMSRITLPGSFFLAFISILPAIIMVIGSVEPMFANFFGGTSLLIIVAVVLDTLQQIESHLLMRHYDGLMKGGRIKGRGGQAAVSGI